MKKLVLKFVLLSCINWMHESQARYLLPKPVESQSSKKITPPETPQPNIDKIISDILHNRIPGTIISERFPYIQLLTIITPSGRLILRTPCNPTNHTSIFSHKNQLATTTEINQVIHQTPYYTDNAIKEHNSIANIVHCLTMGNIISQPGSKRLMKITGSPVVDYIV